MDLSVLSKSRSPALALTAVVAMAGCGGGSSASTAPSRDSSHATSEPAPEWADRANAICRAALPDSSHELVNHLDAAHIRQHGMSIVVAGSRLDALGAPSAAAAKPYAGMIELYRRSAIDHALAVREIRKGNDGNAAAYYSMGLALADKADAIAARFGATDCSRFGMSA